MVQVQDCHLPGLLAGLGTCATDQLTCHAVRFSEHPRNWKSGFDITNTGIVFNSPSWNLVLRPLLSRFIFVNSVYTARHCVHSTFRGIDWLSSLSKAIMFERGFVEYFYFHLRLKYNRQKTLIRLWNRSLISLLTA